MKNWMTCGVLLAILLNPSAGCSAPVDIDKCLAVSETLNPPLVAGEFRPVAIVLPADAQGPITTSDTRDYLWLSSGGDIRVKFGTDPPELPSMKLLNPHSGESIKFFQWKDYSGQDVVIGYWPRNRELDRNVSVTVSVDWSSCESIGRAAQIVRSAKFINDPDKLRVLSVEEDGSAFIAVVINEIGTKKPVRVDDVITRDDGVVIAISPGQVLVRENLWAEGRRTISLKFANSKDN